MSKKKRKHAEVAQEASEQQQQSFDDAPPPEEKGEVESTSESRADETPVDDKLNKGNVEKSGTSNQAESDRPFVEHKHKKFKQVYSRVDVDPTRRYHTPESRESWGPNVKGKKFRKEKGKKKRCPNAGVRIDGSVKSIRLDA